MLPHGYAGSWPTDFRSVRSQQLQIFWTNRQDGRKVKIMKLPKPHWAWNFLLIALAVCLFLPVYVIDRQYAQAVADKALLEARSETTTRHPEKYNNTLNEKMPGRSTPEIHNQREEAAIGSLPENQPGSPNPEIYYRRKVTVGNWMLGLFLLPLSGGLMMRRWVASLLIIILFLLTWHLQSLRY